ncbi:MAG: hypothetical protein AAF846_16005 [Chloroflexota bacterium]
MPIVQVLVFRGTGGVYNTEHPYYSEPALVRAGHVGLIGIIEDKIIGFHPTPEATNAIGGELELLNALKNKIPQAGRLQDDNVYFERADELRAVTNGRTTVYIYEVEITDETLTTIRSWYNEGKEALYNFPNKDGQFRQGESNCAIFWLEQFKIPLPKQTGSIKDLVEIMRNEEYTVWQSNAND